MKVWSSRKLTNPNNFDFNTFVIREKVLRWACLMDHSVALFIIYT